MESSKHNGGYVNNISPGHQFALTGSFLDIYANQSNHFTNLVSVMSSLVFSIKQAATLLSYHFQYSLEQIKSSTLPDY